MSGSKKTIDSFANAHNYMLEKDAFSQQDVDYVYELRSKEKKNAESDAFINGQTSSSIYESLFFEKKFGGMKQRFESQEKFKNVQEMTPNLMNDLIKWLDDDLSKCCEGRKFNKLITVMTGMERAMKTPTKEEMLGQLQENMQNGWIARIFKTDGSNREYESVNLIMPTIFSQIMEDAGSKFRKKADKFIQYILEHDLK